MTKFESYPEYIKAKSKANKDLTAIYLLAFVLLGCIIFLYKHWNETKTVLESWINI